MCGAFVGGLIAGALIVIVVCFWIGAKIMNFDRRIVKAVWSMFSKNTYPNKYEPLTSEETVAPI